MKRQACHVLFRPSQLATQTRHELLAPAGLCHSTVGCLGAPLTSLISVCDHLFSIGTLFTVHTHITEPEKCLLSAQLFLGQLRPILHLSICPAACIFENSFARPNRIGKHTFSKLPYWLIAPFPYNSWRGVLPSRPTVYRLRSMPAYSIIHNSMGHPVSILVLVFSS